MHVTRYLCMTLEKVSLTELDRESSNLTSWNTGMEVIL